MRNNLYNSGFKEQNKCYTRTLEKDKKYIYGTIFILYMKEIKKDFGPCYTIPDYIGAYQFLYRIGVLFTSRHCNPVHAAEQKSLHFFRDTKSNPVCTRAV